MNQAAVDQHAAEGIVDFGLGCHRLGPEAVEIAGHEAALDDFHVGGADRRPDGRSHYPDPRTGREQLAQLGLSHTTAADEQNGPSGEVQEQRQ